jgi:hypothetical protein
LTSQTFTGDLGDLAGADQKCQAAADRVGLFGVYRAWLSTADTDASSRTSYGDYFTTRGELAFAATTFFDAPPLVTITDESGANTAAGPANAWSGSDEKGKRTNDDCANWTSAASVSQAETAQPAASSSTWAGGGPLASCAVAHSLLCFEE